jgi:hypothetical protein
MSRRSRQPAYVRHAGSSGRNLTKPVRAPNEIDGRPLLRVGWQKNLTEWGSKPIYSTSEVESFERIQFGL